jgi:hypothetical protein
MHAKEFPMKPLVGLLMAVLIGLLASGCGSSKRGSDSASSASSSSAAPHYTKADADKDNDVGAPYDDANNKGALNYGRAASPADRQAVTALVTRYYKMALEGDGAGVCSMIILGFAEAIGEDYGEGSAGPSYLKSATTCSGVLDLLLKHLHAQLAVETPRLDVTRVRLIGHRGFAILSFGSMPEREISVAREGHTWKLQAMQDNELP